MHAVDRGELIQQVIAEIRALGTAEEFMSQAAAAALGMHTTDMHAGEVLDREGPMTIGELARAVGISPGAATALIDRLEAAGIAGRAPDPANRRRVLVQPAAEARRRAYTVFAPMIARTMAFLESYGDKELLLIRDFLESARAAVTEHAETLRARQDAGDRGAG